MSVLESRQPAPTPDDDPNRGGEPTAPIPESRDWINDPERFLNRELQWLEFARRVLYLTMDERTPLLERARYLAIVSSLLDEFFMKRVGGLRRQVEVGVTVVTHENVSPARLLRDIRSSVVPLIEQKADCFHHQVVPALRAIGIDLLSYEGLDEDDRDAADAWFERNVFPILTPLAVDPGHRFPFISNLSVSLGVLVRRPGERESLFARVKVPELLPQWYRLEDAAGRQMRYVPLIDIIRNNLDDVFPGMEIVHVEPFRVTRNADVERDYEDADDLLEQIQLELRDRRFAPVVRLQIARDPDPEILSRLCEELELTEADIYEADGLLDHGSLEEIAGLDLPEHRFQPWTPVTPPRLRDDEKDIFTCIREGDILVHHPYESFSGSVERFIREAVKDPNVICIKQALYRTSGESVFVPELIRAAEAGKQVAVLVELRARFDEERNIHWARKLEEAGVHVAYGVVGLKTHTKIALVVRREPDGIRCYGHVGTGNYNSRTARLYEDIGLLTSDPAITEDLIDLFNYITGRSLHDEYEKLLVAPHAMKSEFFEFIEREIEHCRAGRPAGIIAKMNQLQDREMIDALYTASNAGVPIDLIVRGFCTLRPGVPGLSENIRIVSIIGRFLEHSRIYYFRNGQQAELDGDFWIGSGDWMYRNMHARVEAICPIESRTMRQRLWTIIETSLNDQRQGWDMQPDGTYRARNVDTSLPPDDPRVIGTQAHLMRLARESY